MTTAALSPSKTYIEDGTTLNFAVPFRYLSTSDLIVDRIATGGAPVRLAINVHYTATVGTTDAGGTLTLLSTVAGSKLRIRRSTARNQATNYATNDTFPAESHEAALDRSMLIDQEQDVQAADLALRAILVPDGESSATLPPASQRTGGKVLIFDPTSGAPGVGLPAPFLKGDPGGNVESVGNFSAVAGMTIAAGVKSLRLTDRAQAVLIDVTGASQDAIGAGYWWTTSNGGTRTWRIAHTSEFGPMQCGAKGDGIIDDSAAFIAAIQFLNYVVPQFTRQGDGQAEIYLPAGTYRLNQSAVLSNLSVILRGGYKMRGAGRENTVVWLDCTDGATKYLYDNGGTLRMWGCTFEGITFAGGNDWHRRDASNATLGFTNLNAFAKGFKFSGPNWESAHHFIDCHFRYFNQVVEWAGANNADGCKFTQCNFNRNLNLFAVNNPQSFGISCTDCYVEVGFGDFLKYAPATNGGGSFSWRGGDIIQVDDAGIDTYVVSIPSGNNGPDIGNANITISQCHIELRNTLTHLYKIAGTGQPVLSFQQTQVLSTATAQKEYGEVSGYGSVSFTDCPFKEQAGVTGYHTINGGLSGGAGARRGKNATLRFLGHCILQSDFFDADTALATAKGAVKASKGIVWLDGRGVLEVDDACFSNQVADLATQPRVVALACTTLGTLLDNQTVGRSGKVRSINPFYSNVPSQLVTGTQVRLPPFVTIARAWMRLNGAGLTGVSNVRLNIGNQDKSVIYGQTVAAPINTAGGHFLKVDIYQRISDDTLSRDLTFWLDNGAGADCSNNVNAGVLVGAVEYF